MEYATPTLMLIGEASTLVLHKVIGVSENAVNQSSWMPGELGLDD